MTWYILDSDHVSLHQRRQPAVVHRLASVPPDHVFVTIVTVEEQLTRLVGSDSPGFNPRAAHSCLCQPPPCRDLLCSGQPSGL